MPRRHRAAESSRVMVRPPNVTWPEPGDRSPDMRPNRLVLPAPFGPTIPTVSPAPTENDRSSAMTTRPNRFVTWSSSSNGLLSAHLEVGSRAEHSGQSCLYGLRTPVRTGIVNKLAKRYERPQVKSTHVM